MNASHTTKLLIGVAVGLAVTAPVILVRAESRGADSATAENQSGGGADRDSGRSLGPFEEKLKRFFEGFSGSLNDEQKKEFGEAFDNFREQLKEPDKDAQPREFKFEWRNEAPRPNRAQRAERPSRQESAPEAEEAQDEDEADQSPRRRGRIEDRAGSERRSRDSEDPAAQLREQLRRHFEGLNLDEDFFGPFLRELERGAPQGAAPRESGPGRSGKYEKAARRALAEFREVVAPARESVVRVYQRGDQVALATIVTADGYAITKASMLGNGRRLECEAHDGATMPAEVVDTLKAYDLALLKLSGSDFKPVEWNTATDLSAGTLLAAAGPDEDPVAIGVISVPVRNLAPSLKGYLGVIMGDSDKGVIIAKGEGERGGVAAGSAAERAGLKEGDVIIAVDSTPVRTPRELSNLITTHKPEDEVRITYNRDGKEHTVTVVLGSREEVSYGEINGRSISESDLRRLSRAGDPTAQMGGRGNSVADGFPTALQNDLFINVDECGGPIVDIDGRAIGINIARAERTKTYAVPASTLKELLSTVSEGKFFQRVDPSELKRAARKARQDVEDARARLEELERKSKEAESAIEQKK